jgi:hypothetical protein
MVRLAAVERMPHHLTPAVQNDVLCNPSNRVAIGNLSARFAVPPIADFAT